jgi:asparagine synthase (glutamine-hydrolysing)
MRRADAEAIERWAEICKRAGNVVLAATSNDAEVLFEVARPVGPIRDSGASIAVGRASVVSGTIFTYDGYGLENIGQLVADEPAKEICVTAGSYISEHYWGHYSGLFFDPVNGKLVAVRDPTGGEPLFQWHDDTGLMLFANSVALIIEAIGRKLPVDRKLLALNLAYGNGLPNRRTAFEGVSSLLPGECLEVDGRSGRASSDLPWWRRTADGPRNSGRLDQVLEAVVRARSQVDGKVSLQLSGGLDSSALLGLAGKIGLQSQMHCLSYFRTGGTMDERAYVQMAARHAHTDLTEVDVSELQYPVDLAPRYRFTARPHARVLFSQLGEAFDTQSLAAGCDTYWVGYGGDMLFSNYPGSHLIVDAWRLNGVRGMFKCAVEIALYQEKALWRVLWEAVAHRPSRKAQTQWAAMKENWSSSDEDLRDADHGAFRLIDRCFGSVRSPGHRQRLYDVFYDMWQSSEQKPYYAAGGVNYVRPYYSEPALASIFSTPAFETIQFGLNRYPQREIVADVMPRKLSRRISKGGADDQTYRALRSEAGKFEQILRNGHLASMGLIGKNDCRVDLATIELGKAHKNFSILNALANEVWLRGHEDVLIF